MESFQTFLYVLLGICGGITAIGAAAKYLFSLSKPFLNLKNRIIDIEKDNVAIKQQIKEMLEQLENYKNIAKEKPQFIFDIEVQVSQLKNQILENERETKLILHQLLTLSNYLTSKDETSLEELQNTNKSIINFLIDGKK